jgi:hypothetical protein
MPEAQGIKLGRHDVTGETRKIGYGSSRILGRVEEEIDVARVQV